MNMAANLKNEEVECIEKCAKKYFNINDSEFFSICEYKVNFPVKLLGYLGEHKYCCVKIHHENQYKSMTLFIKSMPEDEMRIEEIKSLQFFERECCIYTDIFSHFNNREVSFFPKILHIRNNEQLYFEDVSVKGYRITNSRESLDDAHCLITLKQIGMMHAQSLILEEMKTKESKRMYRIKDEFDAILNNYGYVYEGWYHIGVTAGLEAAKTSPNMDKIINMELFTEKWYEFFKIALNMCMPSTTERNVLSHRDLWSNNLMYRYDENGKPVHCIIVDYQACGSMVPAGDVMSFIYLNVNDERRHVNLEKYLNCYYRSLDDELRRCGLNAEELIPWIDFRKSCEEYKVYALMQCVILLQLALIEGKQAKDIFQDPIRYNHYMYVSRAELVLDLIKNDKIFRDLLMFSLDDIIKRCI